MYTVRCQHSRIRLPGQITFLLALIVATVVMVFAAFTVAILLTGWPLR